MSIKITEEMLSEAMALASRLQSEGPMACKDDAVKLKGQFREKMEMKPAAVAGQKCNGCGGCGACLIDGPVPDIEVAFVTLTINFV